MFFKINKHQKGFTLIELLLVIGILVILIGSVIIAINPFKQFEQARNVARDSHIKSIKDAVYSYQIDHRGQYPNCIPDYNEFIEISECESELVPVFIANLPEDPSQGENYMIGYEDEQETRIKVYSTSGEYSGVIPPEEPEDPILPITNGLVFRLDANSITGLQDGDKVSQWLDLSGNNNHALQSEENRKPIYKTNIIKNKSIVRFDGTKSLLANNSNSLNITPNITIIAVAKPNITDNGHRRILIKGHTAWSEPYYFYSLWSHSSYLGFGININGARKWAIYNGGITSNNVYILSGRYDGARQQWYVNGSLIGSRNQSGNMSINNQPLRIGSTQASPGSTWFKGDIAEILIYNRALSDTERQEVESYLSEKWLD